ncbi:MAG: indolepyruvate ferredoxin oxidoreductase subunit alpha [Candidatus Thermoplasmatota archaeon]|nr:indolepyruvate ferredoxin oxidoreductase subunit alpha [Candidatus Thermoplasmatota archaeon]
MTLLSLLLDNEENGKKLFLLGNEAIARGALEASVSVVTTYPGTPSSEIGDTLYDLHKEAGIKFQFSVNEKVAVETAFAASISGVRSLVFMKHVGLNVASDPFVTTAYTGTRAGMVVLTADDPSMYSSQNEQDNRHYAELAHIPMIEPSNPQEAKDFLVKAYEISEKYNIPVLFRTTTRVAHMRAPVALGKIEKEHVSVAQFVKDPERFVSLPSNALRLKEKLIEKISEIEKESDSYDLNRIERIGSGGIGIITSGASFNSVMDVVNEYALDADILKIGLSYPAPRDMISAFLSEHERVVVIEELDPYLENNVRITSQINGLKTIINGKIDGYFSYSHEFTPDTVAQSLSKIMGFPYTPIVAVKSVLPPRPPVLCPGCPHRATYYAVERAVKMMKVDPVYSSDIGCYSLGFYEPYREADTMISMGSSIGLANGFSLVSGRKVIAFIGDSTFYHSGIEPLINAYHYGLNMLVMILDNDVTAMTGQQPNPGSDTDTEVAPVKIEEIVRGIGISDIAIVDPYDTAVTLKTITSALRNDGISVIISRRECAILRDRKMQKNGKLQVYTVNQDKCGLCMNCVENFACPAIYIEDKRIKINPDLCDGCGVCSQVYVCPYRAIEVEHASI